MGLLLTGNRNSMLIGTPLSKQQPCNSTQGLMEIAMAPEEFTAALNGATQEQLDSLEQAHWRYMNLAGIIFDGIAPDVVAADKAAFPHYIKQDNDRPVFSDADCKDFMVAITGLSAEFCEAWRDRDFYDLHGETADDMASRQQPKI